MAVRKHFKWNNWSLFDGAKDTGFKIQPEAVQIDEGYHEMWRVIWPDGVASDDYYNKTRAKDHAELEYDRGTRTDD